MQIGPLGYAAGFSSRDCGISKFGSWSSSSSTSIGTSAKPCGLGLRGRTEGKRIPPEGATLGEHRGSEGED